MKTTTKDQRKTVGLLLLGGLHHMLHLVPVSKGLEREGDFDVIVYVTTAAEREACLDLLSALKADKTKVEILKANGLAKMISPKLGFLLSNMKIWTQLDALIVAERTSTILRFFSKKLPTFIHVPHGAGDRAQSYDRRIRHFDHVLVAGPKDKRRMLELKLVTARTCHVTGYIKPFAVQLMDAQSEVMFTNDRPTVLYNPHFCERLSSWNSFGLELLEAFSQCQNFNYIVAPHMRLFADATAKSRDKTEAFAQFENIHIDLGSHRSTDMSYTRAADIYLGDVSSQIYEFLSGPKPCVFLGHEKTQWRNNPDYAHWSYGAVCHSVPDVIQQLESAEARLPEFTTHQMTGCENAKGDAAWDPIERAAAAVKLILNR